LKAISTIEDLNLLTQDTKKANFEAHKKAGAVDNRSAFRMLFPKSGQEDAIVKEQLQVLKKVRESLPEEISVTPQIASFLFITSNEFDKDKKQWQTDHKPGWNFLKAVTTPLWTFAFFSPVHAVTGLASTVDAFANMDKANKAFDEILAKRGEMVDVVLSNYQLQNCGEGFRLIIGKHEQYRERHEAGGRGGAIYSWSTRINEESVGISADFNPENLPKPNHIKNSHNDATKDNETKVDDSWINLAENSWVAREAMKDSDREQGHDGHGK